MNDEFRNDNLPSRFTDTNNNTSSQNSSFDDGSTTTPSHILPQISAEKRSKILQEQRDATIRRMKQQLQCTGVMRHTNCSTKIQSNPPGITSSSDTVYSKNLRPNSLETFGSRTTDAVTTFARNNGANQAAKNDLVVFKAKSINRQSTTKDTSGNVKQCKDDYNEQRYNDFKENREKQISHIDEEVATRSLHEDSSQDEEVVRDNGVQRQRKHTHSIQNDESNSKNKLNPMGKENNVVDSMVESNADESSIYTPTGGRRAYKLQKSPSNITEMTSGIDEQTFCKPTSTMDSIDESDGTDEGTCINDLLSEIKIDDIESIKSFLMKPCPKSCGVVECYVKRTKGIKTKLLPEYRLYLKNGDKFLLASKKLQKHKASKYLITMNTNDFDRDSDNVVGKIRSNVLGTEFQIYDSGTNPKYFDPLYDDRQRYTPRCEYGAVLYESNLMVNRGPRKMQVCINRVNDDGESTRQWQPGHKHEEMIQCFKHHSMTAMPHLISLENRQPQWKEELSSYVLNFNGRVTRASIKNFQLIEQNSDCEDMIMQFGRTGRDDFILDVRWPMSIFQAFAVALSSCDSKIACD